MAILNEAAWVHAPLSGNVIHLAVTTTSALFQIPVSWAGRQCTWQLYSSDLTSALAADVNFGGSTVSCTYDTNSSVTTNVITISTSTGARLYSGKEPKNWVMPTQDVATYFSVDASGSGTLEIVKV